MTLSETLWRTPDHTRWFVIPDSQSPIPGSFAVVTLAGDQASVDPTWAARYEVTEIEARAWAQEEFGLVLEELRRRIDTKLAAGRRVVDRAKREPVAPDSRVTPDSVPALAALMKALPAAIAESLSGDEHRVAAAVERLADIQGRLNGAGIEVGDRLAGFPERLAELRRSFEEKRR